MKYLDVPLLMYHEISEQDNPWCLSPQDFEAQMLFLKEEGYQTISLSELMNNLDGETAGKSVVITFDDGRKGVYTQAYPLLKKYGFKAVVYAVPKWLEGGKAEGTENYSSLMSWEELKELAEQGWEIGSHSFSHLDLTSLSRENLVQELKSSQQVLQDKLGVPVNSFSYPYGKFNEEVRTAVAEVYSTAVTVNQGFEKSNRQFFRQNILRGCLLERFKLLLKRPTLSLCLIVKDEEKFLESCLASVQGLAEEIIVVDTGSTDRTKEIAHKFTDKVYDCPWTNDFSAARNQSLKYAQSDWILVLDADEKIDQKDHFLIKESLNNWEIEGYRIITKNYSNDSGVYNWQPCLGNDLFKQSFSGWYPSIKVRLFQRKKETVFEGKVHELVDTTLKGKIAVLPFYVHHYGHLKDKESKLKRNLELAKQKTAEKPLDAQACFELGVQYKELNELKLAEEALRRSLELTPSVNTLLNLAVVLQKEEKWEEAITFFLKVLEEKPDSAEAYFGLGYCFFRKQKLEDARQYFQLAIKNHPSFLDAYVNLGAVYEKLNQLGLAEEILEKAIALSPGQARSYYNLGVVYERKMELSKAADFYQKAVDLGYVRREELKKRVQKLRRIVYS